MAHKYRQNSQSISPFHGQARLFRDEVVTRQLVLICVLSSAICLAYFYMLDRAFFSSVSFSPIFQFLLTAYDAQIAWISIAVCSLAALWNRPRLILKLVDLLASRPIGLSIIVVMLIASGSIFIYHGHPLCMDEYAAVFQSKIFASGRLFAQLPPAAISWLFVPGFNGVFLIASPDSGRAIEGYWPGFSLLLAPFEFLDAPWLCNALLGGLAIYLIYRVTLDITGDRRAAGWATLFGLASGAFWANAISLYSMQAHLTLNLLFVWLLMNPTSKRALAAGFVGSLALVLHNPFPHMLFALPWIVKFARNKDERRYLSPLAIGYVPIVVGVGLGWVAFRNSIAPDPHDLQTIGEVVRGTFKLPGSAILNMRVAALAKMSVWAVPGLFVIAVFSYLRHRRDPRIGLLAQSAALTFVGYLFVKLDQGHGWGYRYFHSAWGVIPILAACAMTGRPETNQRLASFAGAACILSLLWIVPFQMQQIEHVVSRQMAQLPPPKRPGYNVYFINPIGGFYLADMIQFDPSLSEPDLLLMSHGDRANVELVGRSWPNAKKMDNGAWGEYWHLGPTDQGGLPTSGGARWFFKFAAPSRPD